MKTGVACCRWVEGSTAGYQSDGVRRCVCASWARHLLPPVAPRYGLKRTAQVLGWSPTSHPASPAPAQEVCLDTGGHPAAFMAAATDFCNDQCWGTLSCAVFVHPATQVGARTCMPAGVCMHQKVKGRSALAHSLLVLQPVAAPTVSCTPRSSAQAPRRIRRPGGGAALRQRVHQRAHPHWLCHHQADLGSLPAGRHAAGKGLLLGGRGGWVSGSMGCTRPLCVRVQPGRVSPPGSRCALFGLWQCHAAPHRPHHPPQDIGSGNCAVHNTLLLDHVQKSVLRAPWRFHPAPFWWVGAVQSARWAAPCLNRLSRRSAITLKGQAPSCACCCLLVPSHCPCKPHPRAHCCLPLLPPPGPPPTATWRPWGAPPCASAPFPPCAPCCRWQGRPCRADLQEAAPPPDAMKCNKTPLSAPFC